ncbi:XRE family transcriptional regulator [Agarivorans sp. MS3-6]|uniref:helix-turn-helix domain-containing protein n=1 Tax=Agarivorans sp. TSD2052 TaxID=2937286 RepID=UPI00200EC60A|nr:helix-turn-helix transcriptional regulator [Agarivorans sp. TSD2052]UPW20483.1 helix-turn-helix domain-containing protein [Agarivorans sp. TSD2052]
MSQFSERLQELMGEQSVSGFARKVELNESLIRKYLKGSEPSLSKANQIAQKANCSLEWLATGEGYQYRKAEVVDMEALEKAVELTLAAAEQHDLSVENEKVMKVIVATYQYLRTTRKKDGYFDLQEARPFVRYVMGLCG